MRRRALAIVLIAGVVGAGACTTFGEEGVETPAPTPLPDGGSGDDSALTDGAVTDADAEIPEPIDAGLVADAAECGGRCGPGTTCAALGRCAVTSQPSCTTPAPIVVSEPSTFVGRACKVDETAQVAMCGGLRYAHVFTIGAGVSKFAIRAPSIGQPLQYAIGSPCGNGGCTSVPAQNTAPPTGIKVGDYLVVGAQVCGAYEITFSN